MKKSRLLWIALATITILTGCSKDSGNPDIPDPDEGQPTRIQLRLKNVYNESGTRAAYDTNATEQEVTLKKADVFIFTPGGRFEKHIKLDGATDFTYQNTSSDIWMANTEFEATTGKKNMYVGINLPESMINLVKADGPNVESIHTDPSALYNLAGADWTGMSMFSMEVLSETLDPAPAVNTFTIDVERMAAKVTFHEGKDLDLTEVVDKAIFSNLEFTLGHLNTRIYPLRQQGNKDPNYDAVVSGTPPGTIEYQSHFIPGYDNLSNYVALVEWNETDINNFKPQYLLENTSGKHLKGETSLAVVKASFVPELLASYNQGTDPEIQEEVASAPIPDVLYVLVTEFEVFYFVEQDEALAANDDFYMGKGEVKEYNDGFCYYNIYLNSGGKVPYDVVRNEYYRYRIDAIAALGEPTPGPGDEEKPDPVEETAKLKINVEIIPWEFTEYPWILE